MNEPARPRPSFQPPSAYSAEVTSGSLPGAEASTVISHQGLHALLALPSSARTRHLISAPSAKAPAGTRAEKALPLLCAGVSHSPTLTPALFHHSNRPRTELSASRSRAPRVGCGVAMTGRWSPATHVPPGLDQASAATGALGSELYSMTRLGLFLNFFQP